MNRPESPSPGQDESEDFVPPFTFDADDESSSEWSFDSSSEAPSYEDVYGSEPPPQADADSPENGTEEGSESEEQEMPSAFRYAKEERKKKKEQFARVRNEDFARVGGIFSMLAGIVGSCGPLCAHSLQALTNMSSSLGLAGVGLPDLSPSEDDHVQNKDASLAQSPRLSSGSSRKGVGSTEAHSLSAQFGDAVGVMLGYGLVGGVMDSLFTAFLPGAAGSGKTSKVA